MSAQQRTGHQASWSPVRVDIDHLRPTRQGSDLEGSLAGATMGMAGRALAVVRLLELLAVLRHGITPSRKMCGGKSLASDQPSEK